MAINNYKHNLNQPLQTKDLNVIGSLVASDGVKFSSGPVLIGSGTSTGTASQQLQVTGGAYVSGSLGIGTINPGSTLDVRSSTGTIRAQENTDNYSVLLNPAPGSGPRLSLGQNGSNAFIEFGAYNLFNNLDTKSRDLKIFSTSAPDAFILREATGNIGIGTTNPFSGTINSGLDINRSSVQIHARNIGTTSSAEVWASDQDYFSTPSYKGVGIRKYGTGAAGNVFGSIPFADVGILAFQNTANGLIYTNGAAPLIFGTFSIEALRIDTSQKVIAAAQLNAPLGPVIIGSATSTGTTSQVLQVAGINSSVYIGGSIGLGTLTASARLTLPPGTASANNAPLKFSRGTNLSTIESGAVEFDGTTLNFTPNSSIGRASIPVTIYTSGQGTSLTALSETTSTNIFTAANDTITLPIGTYSLIMNIAVTRGTVSTTSAQLRIRLAGNGTAAGSFSGVSVGSTTDGGQGSCLLTNPASLTNDMLVTPASTVNNGTYVAHITGTLRVTTAGTFIPQYSLSANLTGASTATITSSNNHMIIQSIATSGNAASVGQWS